MRDDAAHRRQLLFGIRKSIRYHNARRRFYERFQSITAALCVMFGTATSFAVLSGVGAYWAAGAAAIVTLAAAADLVMGTSAKMRLHHDLSRRFIALERLVIQRIHPNAIEIRHWESERLNIQADEPPTLRVLDVIVGNELLQAYGADSSQLIPVRWYQRWSAHFVDVHTHLLVERAPKNVEILSVIEPEDELVEA